LEESKGRYPKWRAPKLDDSSGRALESDVFGNLHASFGGGPGEKGDVSRTSPAAYPTIRLRYRDLEEIMLERGLCVDHTTIYRWVQRYAPELEKRCRPVLAGIVNLAEIDELITMNSGQKWGVSPNGRERTLSERSQMKVQWEKLIKRIFKLTIPSGASRQPLVSVRRLTNYRTIFVISVQKDTKHHSCNNNLSFVSDW
jgi:hypothetical protein